MHTITASKTVVALPNLRKEQLAAIAVLSQKWPTARAVTYHPTSPQPITGQTHFCYERPSPRRVYAREAHWTWTQSHGKVTTKLFGELVTIQKFSAKRTHTENATPAPRYKVWFMTIASVKPLYFTWVQRGVTEAVSPSLSYISSPMPYSPECFSPQSSPPSSPVLKATDPSMGDSMLSLLSDSTFFDSEPRKYISDPTITAVVDASSLDFLAEWM